VNGVAAGRARVLCVDDETNVLEGLALHLRRQYDVETATTGLLGLEAIRQRGPFAVVLSDMRMPGMDGAAFLARVREMSPDSVRMLLTGDVDIRAAIAAVNEGQIFRFLTKPCPADQIRLSFAAATKQYHLIIAERVLLEQTLRGSIKTLTEVLSLSNPIAFGRATRIRNLAAALAQELGLRASWQLEVAAMLSQLGMVIVPDETIERHLSGQLLSAEEQAMVARVPKVNQELLAHIPRLEEVRELVAQCYRHRQPNPPLPNQSGGLFLLGHVLQVAVDFDKLESEGLTTQAAVDTIRGRGALYEPSVVEALARCKKSASLGQVKEIPVQSAGVGMILVDDVRTTKGVLLIARGHELTSSSVERLRNFERGSIREPLRVVDKLTSG
jgi:response regulator RpfG family c-di-GMP phosphodiesterase